MFFCIRAHDNHFSGSSPQLFLQPTSVGIGGADARHVPSY